MRWQCGVAGRGGGERFGGARTGAWGAIARLAEVAWPGAGHLAREREFESNMPQFCQRRLALPSSRCAGDGRERGPM